MTLPRRDLAATLLRRFEWAPHLPPDWYRDALCAEVDPDPFYPPKGGTTRPAKKVCAACPVREKCLAYALENREIEGVWGGLGPVERRALLRRRSA